MRGARVLLSMVGHLSTDSAKAYELAFGLVAGSLSVATACRGASVRVI
jgi:hypothetical protein